MFEDVIFSEYLEKEIEFIGSVGDEINFVV